MQPADASIQDRTPTSILQTAEYKTATFPGGWIASARGENRGQRAKASRTPHSLHTLLGRGRASADAGGFVRPTLGGRLLSQVASLTKSWP